MCGRSDDRAGVWVGGGAAIITSPACFLRFFSRALSRWFPRAILNNGDERCFGRGGYTVVVSVSGGCRERDERGVAGKEVLGESDKMRGLTL